MISEGSCDIEDWSNDAENSALHHRNKLHFTIYLNGKQFFKILIIVMSVFVFWFEFMFIFFHAFYFTVYFLVMIPVLS